MPRTVPDAQWKFSKYWWMSRRQIQGVVGWGFGSLPSALFSSFPMLLLLVIPRKDQEEVNSPVLSPRGLITWVETFYHQDNPRGVQSTFAYAVKYGSSKLTISWCCTTETNEKSW